MLLALVGFMPTDGKGTCTIGSLDCTPEARRQMAIRYMCKCTIIHVYNNNNNVHTLLGR